MEVSLVDPLVHVEGFELEVREVVRLLILEPRDPVGPERDRPPATLMGDLHQHHPKGVLGGQQPVAVSPGEFIVPADVVSGLGDGDTNAGAEDLEGMMDRVRMERTGTTQQPPPIMAKGGQVLPA